MLGDEHVRFGERAGETDQDESLAPRPGPTHHLRRDLVGLGVRRLRHGRLLAADRRLALLDLAAHRPGRRRPRAGAVAASPRRPRGPRTGSSLGQGYANRAQPVVATPACCIDRRSSLSASAGVLHSRVFRGRLFKAPATAARSSGVHRLRSVPLGKYWRSRPLVFSFVPRCQGLLGSQKYTSRSALSLRSAWRASSLPRSQVSERRSSAGSVVMVAAIASRTASAP